MRLNLYNVKAMSLKQKHNSTYTGPRSMEYIFPYFFDSSVNVRCVISGGSHGRLPNIGRLGTPGGYRLLPFLDLATRKQTPMRAMQARRKAFPHFTSRRRLIAASFHRTPRSK